MFYSVVGLGKLGASMLAAIAKRGFDVTGVDILSASVDAINMDKTPVFETDLEETIQKYSRRILATLDYKYAVHKSDITFVIVPTPSLDSGLFSTQYVIDAFKEIGKALKTKEKYHLVVLTSTVIPGSSRDCIKYLEEYSGKVCGKDFGFCYSPEFIALGSIIRDFLNPDFTLVGEFDNKSGILLEKCYSEIMENNPPCKRMSIENAELTKIALNTYVTTKITYANMLMDLCERLPGGDIDVVTDAIGSDSRVGKKYLRGSLGYAGCCFPRDNRALASWANSVDSYAELAETTDYINDSLPMHFENKYVKPYYKKGMRVGVLGLAFKTNSNIVEESQSILLLQRLEKHNIDTCGYDVLANDNAKKELVNTIVYDCLENCLVNSDILLVCLPDPVYKNIDFNILKNKGKRTIIVDFWRIFDKEEMKSYPFIKYVAPGCNL